MRGNVALTDVETRQRLFKILTIRKCLLDFPRNGQDEVDVDCFIKITKETNAGKIDELEFGRLDEIILTVKQVHELENSRFKAEQVDRLQLRSSIVSAEEWRACGSLSRKMLSRNLVIDGWLFYVTSLSSLAEGYGNAKFHRLFLKPSSNSQYVGVYFHPANKKLVAKDQPDIVPNSVTLLDVVFGTFKKAELFADILSTCKFEEIVLSFPQKFGPLSSVDGQKIKRLAVRRVRDDSEAEKVVDIARRMKVEEFFTCQTLKEKVLRDLSQHTKVVILSIDDWSKRFTVSEK